MQVQPLAQLYFRTHYDSTIMRIVSLDRRTQDDSSFEVQAALPKKYP